MGRTPKGTNEKLIECGKSILLKYGVRAINIHSICNENQINLGMFFYYFKSKINFIKILLESFIKDVETSIVKEVEGVSDHMEKLRRVTLVSIKMFKEKRGNIEKMLEGIDPHDEMFADLHNSVRERQVKFFRELIDGCKAANYIEPTMEFEKAISVFLGGLMFYAKTLEDLSLSDEQYYQKINEMMDFLCKTIAPTGEKRYLSENAPPPPPATFTK